MDYDFWHKQTPEKPLFPDLIWNRPENRHHAGKLLIIGGNAHSFAAAAEAYASAGKAGAGSIRVMLPSALQRTVGKLFPEAEFAPSTPSGSFARAALAELLVAASWADGVLFAGDLSKNSETAIVIEQFIEKYPGTITLVGDAADYGLALAKLPIKPNVLFVLSFAQAQRYMTAIKSSTALTSDMALVQTVGLFHDQVTDNGVVMIHDRVALVASQGKISTSPFTGSIVAAASSASVWWLQSPNNQFEALTTSLI